MRRLAPTALLLLAACRAEAPMGRFAELDPGGVLPDTSTIDGLFVMHHGADAFDRAPRWTLDSVPLVVFEDGGDPVFDLSGLASILFPPLMRSDGRMLAVGDGILLFGADGQPERVLATLGAGPGEVSSAMPWLGGWYLAGDTLGYFDYGNQRVTRFTPGGGLVDDRAWSVVPSARCASIAVPAVVQERLVVSCGSAVDDSLAVRRAGRLALTDRWLSEPRDLAEFPSPERRAVALESEGIRSGTMRPLALGLWPFVTIQDSMIVIGTQAHGFVIDFVDTAAVVRRQLRFDISRRPVTAAMRQAWIQRDLDGAAKNSAHGGIPVEILMAEARAQVFADALPWHAKLMAGTDGLLWIEEWPTLSDTTWTATAIAREGQVVARVTAPGGGNRRPIWFGSGQVLVREEDDDGLVRFALYRIAKT